MKTIIKNPVSGNMWVSKMPINYQATKRVTSGPCAIGVISRVVPAIGIHQVTQNPTCKLTKRMLTKYYSEQIYPQYPFISKTKIKAALELADNNLHECRLLLDLKTKLVQLKKPLETPQCLRLEKPSNAVDSIDSKSDISDQIKNLSDIVETTDISGSSNVSPSVSSSVYDFSDTDTDIESPIEWLEFRRTKKLEIPTRKIGVVIRKCDTGYEALPL